MKTILLDIDGTLIDSNDAHASAWVDALAEDGFSVVFAAVRLKIGMGADHLLPHISGIKMDSERGKKISKRRAEIFKTKYLPHLKAFPGARELLEKMISQHYNLMVATSASKEDLTALLQQAQLADLLIKKTSAEDAASSKPDPDIIFAALKKSGTSAAQALMIGDTPYDIAAASKAGVQTLAFTCGGWKKEELQNALKIYEGPWDLLEKFHQSPLSNQYMR